MIKLGTTTPILRIFDEALAKDFYVGFLGFEVAWEHRFSENSPLYMQVSKDDCVLHLSGHFGDCCPGGAVRIETQDVRAYSELLNFKNYKHARPGCDSTPWHTTEMSIEDPFGNKLVFFEREVGATK
jgi:hypothetical protein